MNFCIKQQSVIATNKEKNDSSEIHHDSSEIHHDSSEIHHDSSEIHHARFIRDTIV